MPVTLFLGGTKSGKSRLAESYASATDSEVSYIATSEALDDEMKQRIQRHQQQRPSHWHTIEQPIKLASAIARAKTDTILVDCLTLWLTNLLLADNGKQFSDQRDALLTTIENNNKTLIMVSNETNMGIVPMGSLSRRYCDEAGLLHQAIAALSDNVILSVAGLPHVLKGTLDDRLR